MNMMTEQEMQWAVTDVMRGHCKCKDVGNILACNWNCPCGNPVMSGVCENCMGDYLNDLNAMHEAERVLKEKHGHKSVGNLHRNYLLHLMNVMNPGVELWDNGTYLGDWTHAIKTAEATAKQRAEAMCRTLFPERFKE